MAILLCVVLYTLFTVNPVVDGKHFKSALVKMHPDSMNEVAPQSKVRVSFLWYTYFDIET